MKHNSVILTILIAAFAFLQQASCQEQAKAEPKSETKLTAPEAAAVSTQAENNAKTDNAVPKITVEQLIHDFNQVGPGTKNICEFKFTNTGNALLKIEEIQTTCGCTAAELGKREYAPGESGVIKITFRAGKEAGPTSKHLFVKSNDKAAPKLALTIKADVVMKIDYEPKILKLLLNRENAACPEITLTSLDNQPFAIKLIKSTGDFITADVNSSLQATKHVFKPKVSMDKLREGFKGDVEISVTHPDCDSVIIPFEVLSRFTIDPPVITVLKANPNEPVVREFWVLNNYNEDFQVESTSSKNGIVKVLNQEKFENRYKFKLEITPPESEAKKKFFTDVFVVNIKGGNKLEIKCRGFYSGTAKKL